MPKPLSRTKLWAAAVSEAQSALDAVESAKTDLENALEELKALQGEFQDWFDNLPEGPQQTAMGEKLQVICELDFEQELDIDGISEVISEAANAEVPQGFGRD